MAVINALAETSEKLLKVVLSCKVISGILDDSDSLLPLVAFQRYINHLRGELLYLFFKRREKAHLLIKQLDIMENLELSAC